MSNDLESPDSPKSVIRTYSNAARREGSVRHDRSLRVLAINNNYKGVEGEGEGEGGQHMEMDERSSSCPSALTIDIHCQDRLR